MKPAVSLARAFNKRHGGAARGYLKHIDRARAIQSLDFGAREMLIPA